ncbi:hypothetical protein EJV47_23440 [Hymenobacter gummosus]|uniref:DUF4384 domain-containing protein n=1 Tax=Hymenobacter gummosus TaxID=1776032 RepID=A0A3S0H1U8_9BACT|nr:hypothetical protein [Hymenobacter gummosus]RTQ46105.1 hypothetical protein EJV47_23440 [Hymenobacter gummosus]
MRKRWIYRSLLVLPLSLSTTAGRAQQAPADPLAAELRRQLALIQREDQDGTGAEQLEGTTRQLVAYLKRHDVSAADARWLGLARTATAPGDAAELRVYTFDYDTGNPHGAISHPVLQWKNRAGQRFAYSLAVHSAFFAVYPLSSSGRRLYLLLGTQKGSAGCLDYEARVVKLQGDYLLLDIPAFANAASLNLCNVPMTFDARRQELQLDLLGFERFEPDDEAARLLQRWGYRRALPTRQLTLRFDGRRFGK